MRCIGLTVLLVMAVRPGMRAQTASADAEPRAIRGVVMDGVKKQPIGRALVVSADQRLATMTDSEGRFALTVGATAAGSGAGTDGSGQGGSVSAGLQASQQIVALVARRPGYLQVPETPVVAGSGEVRLMLMPEAIVRGRVTAFNGVMPGGVTVNLLHRDVMEGYGVWSPAQSKQTNSRGEYRFADLPAGAYRVTTTEWMEQGQALPANGRGAMRGYPPARYPDTDAGTAGAMTVAAGQTVEADMDLRPESYYEVKLPVAGLPMDQPFSLEVQRSDGQTGFSLGLNTKAHMVEGELPNGSYSVRVESYGQPPVEAAGTIIVAGGPVGTPLTASARGGTPVIVREEYTAPETSAAQSGPVEGRAQPGRTVAVVLLPESEGRQMVGLRETPQGRGNEGLMLDAAPPGRYRVVVTPHRGYAASVSAGGVDLLHNPLVVGAGGGVPIEITLRDDGATLEGTVSALRGAGPPQAAGGVPVAGSVVGTGAFSGAWLLCLPAGEDSAAFRLGFVDPQGRFTVDGLAPGQYRVYAFRRPPQSLEYRNPEVMQRFEATSVPVTLAPGQRAEITVPALSDEEE